MKRFKNPYFIVGLLAVMIAASGVDFNAFTSWPLLLDGLKTIFMNPVAVVAVALAGLGVIIDPTTKGIKDYTK